LDELRNTLPPPKPQVPPIQPSEPQQPKSGKAPTKEPPHQIIKNLVEREIAEGPPQIIVRNTYPDQPVVVDVEGTSPAHFTLGPGTEGSVPNVIEGGQYSLKVTGKNGITTVKDLIPQANTHYILKVPLPVSDSKNQKK
jgi:hypothetical protein